MDVSMHITRVAYIMRITGNHTWKALEKDLRTFQSVQDLTRARERGSGDPTGLLGCRVSVCFSVSPLHHVDWVCSLLKNENGRPWEGAEILQVQYEGISDVQLQPHPHVRRLARLRKEPDTHGNWVPVPRWEPQVSVWLWPFLSCPPGEAWCP